MRSVTGTFQVYDVAEGHRHLLGVDGSFEMRLADDDAARVFAIDM